MMKPKPRFEKQRDERFDDWRRDTVLKNGKKIHLALYSTNLDSVEYKHNGDDTVIVALIERKLVLSHWKLQWTSSQRAQFQLATQAGVPYYVAEHSKDCSMWNVYKIASVKDKPSQESLVLTGGSLVDFIDFLFRIRDQQFTDFNRAQVEQVRGIDENGESILRTAELDALLKGKVA